MHRTSCSHGMKTSSSTHRIFTTQSLQPTKFGIFCLLWICGSMLTNAALPMRGLAVLKPDGTPGDAFCKPLPFYEIS